MLISMMDPDKLSREQITRVVFGSSAEVDDGTQNGECIFVFGGIVIDRVVKGTNLFKQRRAPYILFTGGDKYGQRNPPEAIFLRDEAIKLGVPSESILIEQISNTTKENILASLIVLERTFGLENINRLLLVSAPSHMRRCLLMIKTFMPPWYEFVWCPDDRIHGRRDNWWMDPAEELRVMDELYKVIKGVKGKYFVDEDIDLESD